MNKREIATAYAMQHVGLPYRWGGSDPIDGYDCSGLVQELLASVGLDPAGDQTAAQLYGAFVHAKTHASPQDLEPGSLVFFGPDRLHISHVGFCIGNGIMIEAGGGGSATTSREAAAVQDAFVRLRPISRRRDLIAAVDPFLD